MPNSQLKPLSMSEILQKTSELKSKKEKLDFLRLHHSPQFHWLLNFAFHPGIIFELPETDPPYRPLQVEGEAFGMLYSLMPKMTLFVRGGYRGPLNQTTREGIFIQTLEALEPEDAKLLLSVKNKKIPYKGITAKLIDEAYGSYDPKNPNIICPCKQGGMKFTTNG